MAYDRIYHSNNQHLTEYSGMFHVGMKRDSLENLEDGILETKIKNKLLAGFDGINTDGDDRLSLPEITENALQDVKECRSSARSDLMLGAVPTFFAFLSRKNKKTAAIWSLFSLAAGVTAGFKFYSANKLEKDIEKFNTASLCTTA